MLANFEYSSELWKSFIRVGLHDAYFSFSRTEGVEIQKKPQRGVFATKDLKANAVCFVPASASVTIITDVSNAPSTPAAFSVGRVFQDVNSGNDAVAYIRKFDVSESALSCPFTIHFWNVGITKDSSLGNLELRSRKISIPSSVDGQRKRDIDVPTFVNHVPVKSGDELLLYKPEKRKGDGLEMTAPVAKSGKKGKGKGKGTSGRASR